MQAVAEVAGGVAGPGDEHLADGLEEPAAEPGAGHERDPAVNLEVVEAVEPGGELGLGQGVRLPGGPGGQDRRLPAVDVGRDAAGEAQRAGRHLEPGHRLPEAGLGRRLRRHVGGVGLQPEELLVHGVPGTAGRGLPEPGQLVGVEVDEAVEGQHVGVGGVGRGEDGELVEVEAPDAGLLVGEDEVLAERRQRPGVAVGGVGPGQGDRMVGPVVEPVLPVDERFVQSQASRDGERTDEMRATAAISPPPTSRMAQRVGSVVLWHDSSRLPAGTARRNHISPRPAGPGPA